MPGKSVPAALALLLLAGCGTPQVKTLDAARAGPTVSASTCSTDSVAVVTERLSSAWSRCFTQTSSGSQAVMVNKVPIMLPTRGSTMSVRTESLAAGGNTVVLQGTGGIGIMVFADVRHTDSCQALVDVKAPLSEPAPEWRRKMRHDMVEAAMQYASAPDAPCPSERQKH